MNESPGPIVLVVLDGFGVSSEERGNAIAAAKKPNLDAIEAEFPFTTLQASGAAVGLPWGEAGNSEVGHLTIGAGRVMYHHLPRIIGAVRDGTFYENPAFLNVAKHVKDNRSSLHILGLVSSGSVHSYIDHLWALFEFAKRAGLPRVFLHAVTDGKDAPPQEAADLIGSAAQRIAAEYPNAAIASLIGRFFSMDRDEHWDRIQQAYELLTAAKGRPFANPAEYIKARYGENLSDTFIPPAYLEKDGRPAGRIQDNDGLIAFDFREDSMREIIAAFAKESFDHFPRTRLVNLKIATMTEYDKNLAGVEAAFGPLEIREPLARVLAETGKKQLHIAETEKYAHVTYFFNGGIEKPFPNEDRALVPSTVTPYFDDEPEMKAPEICARMIESLDGYDFIIANFANADMVGHTGNFQAAVKAVEVLDENIGKLKDAILAKHGVLIITGDHGNAEQKINPISGEPITEHTTNPVPFYLVGETYRRKEKTTPEEIAAKKRETGGILADIAPTILEIMRLAKPEEMTGKSLLGLLTGKK